MSKHSSVELNFGSCDIIFTNGDSNIARAYGGEGGSSKLVYPRTHAIAASLLELQIKLGYYETI